MERACKLGRDLDGPLDRDAGLAGQPRGGAVELGHA